MNAYPVALVGLETRHCVVIGGGAVAARKARGLIEAGATPTIISPELCEELQRLAEAGSVRVLQRAYREGDLAGVFVAIAATDSAEVNLQVAAECRREGVLLNVVDQPDLCDIIMPAVVRRRDLIVSVITSGGSPALSAHLRRMLEKVITPAYGDLLAILSALRPRVRHAVPREDQAEVWEGLLDGRVLEAVEAEGVAAGTTIAEAIVREHTRHKSAQE